MLKRFAVAALLFFWAAGPGPVFGQTLDQLMEMVKVFDRAETLREQGKIAEAAKEYEHLAQLHERYFGPTHKDTGASWNNAAVQFMYIGEYAKAESYFQKALKVYELRVGPNHPETGNTVNNLGLVYWNLGQLAKAETYLQRGLKIRQANLEADHVDIGQSLNNLGLLKWNLGQLDQGYDLLMRALEIREKKLGRHPDVAATLNNLAIMQEARGLYDQVEPLLMRALEVNEALQGKSHPDVAKNLFNLGKLYYSTGQFDKAEKAYLRSQRILEETVGKNSPDIANAFNNLGLVYASLGQYEKARNLYQQSLAIRKDKLPADHPDIGDSLTNLGNIAQSLEELDEAEKLFRQSLKLYEDKYGRKHAAVAGALHNLANLAHGRRQWKEAEALYTKCLQLREATLGKQHSQTALTVNNLGVLYEEMGQYAKAEGLYQRALEIRQAKFGPDAQEVAQVHQNLAVVKAFTGQWAVAAQEMERSSRIYRRHADRHLSLLTEAEQLAFLENVVRPSWYRGLSLGLLRQNDEATRELSAGWLLNGKALIHESMADTLLMARRAKGKDQQLMLQALDDLRRRLAMYAYRGTPAGQEKDILLMLGQLAQEEAAVARRVRHSLGQPVREDPWFEVAEVRKAVPADAVLIEIARIFVWNFDAQKPTPSWLPARYVAWVIPAEGNGPLQIVDLGEAERIDKVVHQVRVRLAEAQGSAKQPGTIQKVGEPASEKMIRQDLAALGTQVLDPLLPHIGKARRWILSPDYALWLVPWAALPVTADRYAVEDYQIDYVLSGKDLVPRPVPASSQGPVVFADPDFDLDAKAGRDNTREVEERDPNGKATGLKLPKASRLPGSAAEAEAIMPHLAKFAGAQPTLFLDKQAQESFFKKLQRPRVLVLSTHGFFLPRPPIQLPEKTSAAKEKLAGRLAPQDHPWLRSGLLLAGCNRVGSVQGEGEDGILTGLEILGADLSGTELVVLSACETGLGDIQVSEGVAGLRQAFHLAGSQHVLASLWQVPDRETALLMNAFFDHLAKGQQKGEAWRNAQLSLIQKRREAFAAAHPFFWAAFTLTAVEGRPGAVEALASDPAGPQWHRDYFTGQELGQKQKKPLAVFVGAGAAGYHQVGREPRLSRQVLDLLAKKYVCVYLDVSTQDGRKLAQSLEIPDVGLVISDRSGARQVFWQQGPMSGAALLERLRKHAE